MPAATPSGQLGEAAEVEREERPAAHRVDVGERVGGGDAAEAPRVVADRGDEVGGGDEGAAVAAVCEQIHAGIVGGLRAHQHPAGSSAAREGTAPRGRRHEGRDEVEEVPRTDLRRSTARRGTRGEAELPPEQRHAAGDCMGYAERCRAAPAS